MHKGLELKHNRLTATQLFLHGVSITLFCLMVNEVGLEKIYSNPYPFVILFITFFIGNIVICLYFSAKLNEIEEEPKRKYGIVKKERNVKKNTEMATDEYELSPTMNRMNKLVQDSMKTMERSGIIVKKMNKNEKVNIERFVRASENLAETVKNVEISTFALFVTIPADEFINKGDLIYVLLKENRLEEDFNNICNWLRIYNSTFANDRPKILSNKINSAITVGELFNKILEFNKKLKSLKY